MPHFFAMSRIVVLPNPIFWKSWSETSRIFFLVASFFDSRRPISPLFGVSTFLEHDGAQHERGETGRGPARGNPEDHAPSGGRQERRRRRERRGPEERGLDHPP